MARDDEVMIQDVDPLNARIYFNGLMYVGGRRMVPRPDYFAPYFTKQSAERVSQVRSAGISCYSRVFVVHELTAANLKQSAAEAQVDHQIRGHPNWASWQHGLQNVAKRAIDENWGDTNDPHRLYFLLASENLSQTIDKCGWLPRIPHGFGSSFERLKRAKCLRELKR